MKLYTITGKYVVDGLQAPCVFEAAVKKAEEYTQSWSQRKNNRVMMKVHTEEHPIQYSFGFHCDDLDESRGPVKKGDWHEICRIEEHSPYMGTAIIPADRVNEEFEKATTWPDGGKGYDLTKKGNAQYVSRDTQLAWQHWLSGWRKAEQIL